MLALRLALRDLRGGFRGLRLLGICLFLGVLALAAVGSLSSSIVAALSAQGQSILGGDIAFDVSQREANADELGAIRRLGPTSQVISMRAMAARTDGRESVLAELKGVDDAYPLYGALRMEPGARAPRPRGNGVAVAPALAERLDVGIGDPIRIGAATFIVTGIIAVEPDRIGAGFTLGPTALVDRAGLDATGLVMPGSLYTARYRVKLPATADLEATGEAFTERFPDAGWDIDDRTNGAPGTRRFIERLGQFLSLVGLTALVVAGIGVGNGVASHLESKRAAIATMKAMGASSALIFRVYLIEILLVAAGGILLGLAAGAVTPAIIAAVAGSALPIPPRLGIYPLPLAVSAAYGVLIALVFALAPLARARAVPAASLFRGEVSEGWRMERGTMLITAILIGLIAALAIGTAREPMFAAMFVGAAALLIGLLFLLGSLIRRGAAALPRPRRPLLRLAIANLHRPGAQTGRLVVALGLGLTLFTTLAVIETNLSGQIERTVPKRAPSFFVLDIPQAEIDQFRGLIAARAPGAHLNTVPSLRGPVVAIDDQRVADMKDIPDGAWILRGDRGLTFGGALPEGSRIVEGQWWPANYAGPPLVSLDIEAARALNLRIGQMLTISVLGVEVPARIASFREINWDTMGLNFALIFSPGALDGAPHSYLATIAVPEAQERGLSRAVTSAFPSVSMIRVKDVIGTVAGMLDQMAVAVRAAASVAIAAGIAVLVGAIAAARRHRVYDAVMLKLLGATRVQVLGAQAIEYALLSIVIAIVALIFGAAAGWYVVVQIFEMDWAPGWGTVLATLGAGAVMTLGLGLAGSLPALAARPARALRAL